MTRKESQEIFINNFINNKKEININFIKKGKPINYVRERSTSRSNKKRGQHFYNPKGQLIQDFKKEFLHSLTEEKRNEIKNTFNSEYYVELNIKYFLPIPKNDPQRIQKLKELGILKPVTRPDIDNYDKFILDACHDVLYEDDSHCTKILSEKYYGLEPRTEIVAKIVYFKED